MCDKDRLWSVARRIQGEAIRCEHDLAEAFIAKEWFAVSRLWPRQRELHQEAAACFAAASLL